MADSADSQAALVSIHPRFVDAILRGEKSFEFRRRPFARDVSVIWLYATKPVGRIMGHAVVKRVIVKDVDALWDHCVGRGGITRAEFDSYFTGVQEGVALELDSVVDWGAGVPLSTLAPELKPPQSFVYVSRAAAASAGAARQVARIGGAPALAQERTAESG